MKRRHGVLFSAVRDALISLAVVAVVTATVCFAVGSAQQSRLSENAKIIENGVRRAAAECYATEGFYPDSIDYLIEKYGLYTDSEHCIIHYSPISSNIMPDIRVTAR